MPTSIVVTCHGELKTNINVFNAVCSYTAAAAAVSPLIENWVQIIE